MKKPPSGFKIVGCWLLYVVMVLGVLAIVHSCAHAHDHNHPELNDWFKSLHARDGAWCCDEKDAQTADEWGTEGGHYRVRIEGAWVTVPDGAIVDGPNRAQVAKVWSWHKDGGPAVRCFMPGSMT